MLNLKQTFLVLTAAFLPLIYIFLFRLIQELKFNVIFRGLIAGSCGAIGIFLFKTIFMSESFSLSSKETLTVTLFISLVEAGLLEECFKNLFFLFSINSFKDKLQPLDNSEILYIGLLTGLGFGIIENISYALNPETANFTNIWDRTFTTIPAHMFMNGSFAYIYILTRNIPLALIAGILFHGLYDFFALPSTVLGSALVKLTLLIGLGFNLYFIKTTKNINRLT
jgi:RsiW-degrading membrane proteinase PrsW (M82 family)